MSKLIVPAAHVASVRLLRVTPIDASANPYAVPTGNLSQMPSPALANPVDAADLRSLEALDKRFGPLRIGEMAASRVELSALGATVHGQPISPANSAMRSPDKPFLDALNFDSARVQARLQAVAHPNSELTAMLFYEIACQRSVDAPPLFVSDTPLDPGSAMERLNRLGEAAQKLDIHRVDTLDNAPGWVSKSKSYLMSGGGVGMQAFGIYSGYRAMMDAIKHGDTLEALFQGGSIAAELGSLIIEQGLSKTGQAMLTNGATALKYFPLTSVGKYMSRGAGLFASAITLPFDIVDAVNSFNAAAATKGKVAQDHYVSGGMSVAGAGISLVLGVAALAGFGSTAGPIGLLAAGLLIAASMIYQAARVVDDIDDYIELTFHERLRSGWFALTGKELDKEVMDRFKLSKGFDDYHKHMELSAREMLEGAYKNSIEHVVNGIFSAELKSVELWQYQWDESAGEKPFQLDTRAVIVDGDDVIDASNGLPPDLKGKVSGSPGDDKGVFWRLGGGNDRVTGVQAQSNLFIFRDGYKAITGGEKNDAFYQEVTEQELDRPGQPSSISVLDGKAGSDTLAFEGRRPVTDTVYVGHDINLHTGKVALRQLDPGADTVEVMQLTDIENVSTLRAGTSHVTGNEQSNRVSANGYDRISTGDGDDVIGVYGPQCRIDGGSGKDRYYIADSNVQTTIRDNGADTSVIEFGWPIERIQRWQIVDTSLVIRSLRGEDGNDPDHVLTLENVYQTIDGQRRLKNARWLFRTQDGYELLALLPDQPGERPSQDIEVAITVKGQPASAPAILNDGTVAIGSQGSHRYFVARTERRVEFIAASDAAATAATVYLDFKDSEIIDLVLSYDATLRDGVSGNTHLSYRNICLSFFLASKVVAFKGVIQTIAAATGHSGRNSLKVTTPRLAQDIVLVMQDEVSYRLQVPEFDYEDDAANPGTRTRSTRSCLNRRKGKYLLTRPLITEKPPLTAQASKVVIDARPHTGIYLLEGQSATYDIFLSSNCIVRLSTPGAAAKTANASTWNLFTSTLSETVTRTDIRLEDNRLRIASVTIELPDIEIDVPVESISVATSSGNI